MNLYRVTFACGSGLDVIAPTLSCAVLRARILVWQATGMWWDAVGEMRTA